MKYVSGFVAGMSIAALLMIIFTNLSAQSNINKVEHIKTGDIDWVCIDNGDYTRSCDVVQKYQ